jgi:thiamine kinase-like enzyme
MKILTRHVLGKMKKDPKLLDLYEPLFLIETGDCKHFVKDSEGEYWRTTNFFDAYKTFDNLATPGHGMEIGKCLGRFHNLVSDIDTTTLGDSLPGFHHTEKYFEKFIKALDEPKAQKMIQSDTELKNLVAKLTQRKKYAYRFKEAIESGEIKTRVVHNDPKINNFMIDPKTERAMCLIDLDTVKEGLIHYDFGDCMRSATNSLGEETLDFENVSVNIDIFKNIATGYLSQAKEFLTANEINLLFESIKILAFELSVRFITSHLLQDGYFKENYKGNNLNRAYVQYKLLLDLEMKEPFLKDIIMAALSES